MWKEDRLNALKRRAVRLMSADVRAESTMLSVLCKLTRSEIRGFGRQGELLSDTILRIAKELRFPRIVVENTLNRSIYPSLTDFRSVYQACQANYESSMNGQSDQEIQDICARSGYTFVLFNCIKRWSFDCGMLESIELEDDQLYERAKGGLIYRNRVFHDAVGVLETSLDNKWKGWEKLWSYF